MYVDKEFDYRELLVCYKDKFGVNAWEDERMWELAQNTGALWLHASLSRHPSRVTRPEDAKLFVVPVDAYLSFKAGACGGSEHKDRMEGALKKLQKSHWWNKDQVYHVHTAATLGGGEPVRSFQAAKTSATRVFRRFASTPCREPRGLDGRFVWVRLLVRRWRVTCGGVFAAYVGFLHEREVVCLFGPRLALSSVS
jgi:hypothetical protein